MFNGVEKAADVVALNASMKQIASKIVGETFGETW